MSRAAAPPSSLASAFGRGDLKQRLKAWGERVVPRLRRLGLDVAECRVEGDRLVFLPDARLTMAMDGDGLVLSLELPVADVASLQQRLVEPERALELAAAVESLPEQFAMGSRDDARPAPVAGATTDDLRALLERLDRGQEPLWIGWTVSRADALAHASMLDELLADAAVALGSVLALPAWTPASSSGAAAGERGGRQRARRDEDRGGTKRRARARSRDRDRDHDELESEPETPEQEPPPDALQRAAVRRPLRAALRRKPIATDDPGAPVDKGVRVRVLEGPFAGKVGAVQELDGKGGARVLLGLLAVRIDVKDLIACAEGRVRPRLSSSHRKPLPVRS
jgi:hypothetical protein